MLLFINLSDSHFSSHGLAVSHISSSSTWFVVSRVWGVRWESSVGTVLDKSSSRRFASIAAPQVSRRSPLRLWWHCRYFPMNLLPAVMVCRCIHSRLENTTRTLNVAQCFRVTPSTPFVVIVLPLFTSPLTQGASCELLAFYRFVTLYLLFIIKLYSL